MSIIQNRNILRINQDSLSLAVSPFDDSDPLLKSGSNISTHWSGPLSTGETVLMIINPLNTTTDIKLEWQQMREFNQSSGITFHFTEIGGENVWTGASTQGFIFNGVPSHGSLVMTISAADTPEGETVDEWAYSTWSEQK